MFGGKGSRVSRLGRLARLVWGFRFHRLTERVFATTDALRPCSQPPHSVPMETRHGASTQAVYMATCSGLFDACACNKAWPYEMLLSLARRTTVETEKSSAETSKRQADPLAKSPGAGYPSYVQPCVCYRDRHPMAIRTLRHGEKFSPWRPPPSESTLA